MPGWMDEIDRKHALELEVQKRIYQQYCMDTFQVALHRRGYGLKRIDEITDAWESVFYEYADALVCKPESDVAQEHIDAELNDILKGARPLIPFKKRYPFVKQDRYGRRQKK